MNKPENKTIEQIRDEGADSGEWSKSDYKAGFDARGKIEEERTKKLIEALEFCKKRLEHIETFKCHFTLGKSGCNIENQMSITKANEALQEWGYK